MIHKKDTIYRAEHPKIAPFSFDEKVSQVFDDMINRSVPCYSMLLKSLPILVARYAQSESHFYDLGCSLGACFRASYAHLPKDCQVIAIDSSEAMINRLNEEIMPNFPRYPNNSIHIEVADLLKTSIHDASFVCLNFVLQFLSPKSRTAVIQRIWAGLKPGGVLLLSEKIHFSDPIEQDLMTELYLRFKAQNGYNELEIAQKRSALENILITDSIQTHYQRLEQIGFSPITQWLQTFNFVSFLAQKPL